MKLKSTVRFTPAQLQAKLDAAYVTAGWQPRQPSNAELSSVATLIEYRYAPVLANTGPYRQFVWAYIMTLALNAPDTVQATAYTVSGHAVTEMRRAYQHHGAS